MKHITPKALHAATLTLALGLGACSEASDDDGPTAVGGNGGQGAAGGSVGGGAGGDVGGNGGIPVGGNGGAPMGGEGGQVGGNGGEPMGGDPMGGAGGEPAELTCETFCADFEDTCPAAYSVRGDCDDCPDVLAGDSAPHQRAQAICQQAVNGGTCNAYYACVGDSDGLTAAAQALTVTLGGAIAGVGTLDVERMDAWAIVGTKNSGNPGDLELLVNIDAEFFRVEFDDLGGVGAAGVYPAADYPVALETSELDVELTDGDITVAALSLDPLVVQISGTFTNADGDTLTVSATTETETETEPPEEAECGTLCDLFAEGCQGAVAIQGACADDCVTILDAVEGEDHPETFERAAGVCARAQASESCQALYACVLDDDGLTAVAEGGVALTLSGEAGGYVYNLDQDNAWAAVGAKGSGDPADLELIVADGADFYTIEIDDFAVAAADNISLDAADHRVRIKRGGEEADLELGAIEVSRFAIDGAFDLSVEVSMEGTEDAITLTASGTLR